MGWLDTLIAAFTRPPAPDLAQCGKTVISVATEQWADGIADPRQADDSIIGRTQKGSIDRYIRDGLGWTWEPRSRGDGSFEWCGAFAAWCWSHVGLNAEARKTYWASTYRLDRWARYESVNGKQNKKPKAGPHRLLAELDERSTVLPFEPQAGDVLLIGPQGSGYGKHICLVESYADGVFSTIEGNGTGRAPNGKIWQGVVRGKRKLGGEGWHARRLIRPAPSDLT
jgi:hypothetical protein